MQEPLADKSAAVEKRNESKPLLWSLWVQVLFLFLALSQWWLDKNAFSLSLLLGVLAFAVPYGWFTWYTFLTLRMDAPPERKMQRLYRGEAQKFLMTAVFCGVVFVRVHPLDVAGFFSAFVIVMLLGLAVPAWLRYRLDSKVDRV